ncbi:uncharacterized protein LOC102462209 isoform X2 [Pelodiscus sinensis]|uniref:uncharacterized protein LOC102462209 isoform X2 n=1 Tax=Pelodiscus sinensis TaxID=13735 RepID=UPI003F6D3594
MDSEQPLNERQGDLPSPKPREAAGQKSWLIIGIGVITVVLIVAVVAILFLVRWPPESNLPHVSTSAQQIAKCPGACCPDGWVGYRGKCYYFSDAEGTWNSSQSFCSSFNASLAGIDTEKDLVSGERKRRLRVPERQLCHFILVPHTALLDLQQTRRDAKRGRDAGGLTGEG